MPQKKIVPVISLPKEFNEKLPGFLEQGKKLSILLDYDGTLAPITDDPDLTEMPEELEQTLKRLACNPKIVMAIISGRGIDDVKDKVGIEGIYYSGNHGIEIQSPNGTRSDYELPKDVKTEYMKLVEELTRNVSRNGAWVEDKRCSLTYHFRETPEKFVEAQTNQATKIIEAHGFIANKAHAAIEAKPPVNWNKGEAALFILKKHFGDDWQNKTNVVFAGDDTTDEDAMKALQGTGKTFRISSDPEIETYADFRLPSQSVMTPLLKWIYNAYA